MSKLFGCHGTDSFRDLDPHRSCKRERVDY